MWRRSLFFPTVADVGAVIHLRDHHVLDSGIDLSLRLLHRLAETDNDENHAGRSRDEPLSVGLLHVFDVDVIRRRLLEDDGGVFREGVECFVVVERKWRNDDAYADLKSAANFQFGIGAGSKVEEELSACPLAGC